MSSTLSQDAAGSAVTVHDVVDLGAVPPTPARLHGRSHPARASDLERVIRRVAREVAASLDISDTASLTELAHRIGRDLKPEIIPDRAYRINELKAFGFKRGRTYKAARAGQLVIRKNGRASFVMGRDLLAMIEHAPTLGAPVVRANPADAPARRGRPRKSLVSTKPSGLGDG